MNFREHALKTNGQKCHKTATKMEKYWPKITKNDQKSQWNTLNMLQLNPPGQYHPERTEKRSKTAKSTQKGDFARQNLPLRKWF